MLDTVKIKLKRGKIQKPENFSPEFERREYKDLTKTEKKLRNNYLKKFILKSEIRNSGFYKPSVEVYEKLDRETRKVYREVLIEFSVPKIILDNNLEEVSENDLNKVVSLLQKRLNEIGVYTKTEFLKESVVTSRLHLGKNVILPENYSMKNILDCLKNTELGKDFDVTERQITQLRYENKLKNKNEILHYYSGSREYVIYDKTKDILNRKLKSIDKDKIPFEKELLETHNLINREIFRYEYRMNRFNVIKSEVNKALHRNKKEDITLEVVFNEKLWKVILINSWNKILDRAENQLSLKFNGPDKPEDVIRMLFIKCTNGKKDVHSQNLAFSSYGLACMASQFGMKYIRSECEKFWSKRACGDRLRKKIKKASKLMSGLRYPDNIDFVDSEINKFKKLTRDSL
jgi:uncharacterized protein YaaW (UPF0174 family)